MSLSVETAPHTLKDWHLAHYAAMATPPDFNTTLRRLDRCVADLAAVRPAGDDALLAGVAEHVRLALVELVTVDAKRPREHRLKRARLAQGATLWSSPVSHAGIEAAMAAGASRLGV